MTDLGADGAAAFAAAASTTDRLFWLDGGGTSSWSGQRSILGVLSERDVSLTFDAGNRVVTRHDGVGEEVVGDDIFEALEDHIGADSGDPSVHWVGYLGYACRTDLPGRPAVGLPDALWMRVRDPFVFEHPAPTGEIGPGSGDDIGGPVDPAYLQAFDEVQRQLRLGNTYEVNLTYRERVVAAQDPVATYLRLRELNPAPYSGFLQHRGLHLLSSSPERYATIDRHRTIETKPIKGTTLRSTDAEADAAERERLRTDPRFRAENLMIVDLLRNDLATVCSPGSVEVPGLMQVESYRSVHQLVSTVRGRLRDDVSTVTALKSLFPAGSMTGAPKLRTMEIIDRVESTPRGVYAGAFGWICADGRADLSVVIRTLIATPSGAGWVYELGTGGGITVRSTAAEEFAESRWKAARLHAALRP